MSSTQLEKLQLGDESTVESLVRELYPKIHAYIYRRIFNNEKAKDLTQETFCRFFGNIRQYDEKGKLLNYLYRIALHLIYDETKKSDADQLMEDKPMIDHTYDAHQMLMQKETTVILQRWVKQLPQHLQDVIRLRYEEELKFKDISKILGINVSTIKSQLKLAIEILKTKEREEQLR